MDTLKKNGKESYVLLNKVVLPNWCPEVRKDLCSLLSPAVLENFGTNTEKAEDPAEDVALEVEFSLNILDSIFKKMAEPEPAKVEAAAQKPEAQAEAAAAPLEVPTPSRTVKEEPDELVGDKQKQDEALQAIQVDSQTLEELAAPPSPPPLADEPHKIDFDKLGFEERKVLFDHIQNCSVFKSFVTWMCCKHNFQCHKMDTALSLMDDQFGAGSHLRYFATFAASNSELVAWDPVKIIRGTLGSGPTASDAVTQPAEEVGDADQALAKLQSEMMQGQHQFQAPKDGNLQKKSDGLVSAAQAESKSIILQDDDHDDAMDGVEAEEPAEPEKPAEPEEPAEPEKPADPEPADPEKASDSDVSEMFVPEGEAVPEEELESLPYTLIKTLLSSSATAKGEVVVGAMAGADLLRNPMRASRSRMRKSARRRERPSEILGQVAWFVQAPAS